MAKWRDTYDRLAGTFAASWRKTDSKDSVEGGSPSADAGSGGLVEGNTKMSKELDDVDNIIQEKLGYSSKIFKHILNIKILLDCQALNKDGDEFELSLPEQVYSDYCAYQGLSASYFLEAQDPVIARLYGTRIKLIPKKAAKTIEVDGVKYQEVQDG
jgi:hypothetical protein